MLEFVNSKIIKIIKIIIGRFDNYNAYKLINYNTFIISELSQ